jgi:hypothetical protein
MGYKRPDLEMQYALTLLQPYMKLLRENRKLRRKFLKFAEQRTQIPIWRLRQRLYNINHGRFPSTLVALLIVEFFEGERSTPTVEESLPPMPELLLHAGNTKALGGASKEPAAIVTSNGMVDLEWIRFHSPSDGDCHIVRGAVTVIGGPPGVGKSRGATALAVAGATCRDWFGLKVVRPFKSLILQSENGRSRLAKDFAAFSSGTIDDFIRVSEPPAYGMAFEHAEFREALARDLAEFGPDVVILDPWNAVVPDDKQKDYLEAFQAIRKVVSHGDSAPALVIVAHTRKPKTEDRPKGRALLNSLSGSYTLGSVPRCVFVMQPASDDPGDDRVIWTCCKNNDGEIAEPSVWHRRNGLFEPCADFDLVEFNGQSGRGKTEITKNILIALFEGGKQKLTRSEAVERLMEITDCQKSAAYNALRIDGRFAAFLTESEGILCWKS